MRSSALNARNSMADAGSSNGEAALSSKTRLTRAEWSREINASNSIWNCHQGSYSKITQNALKGDAKPLAIIYLYCGKNKRCPWVIEFAVSEESFHVTVESLAGAILDSVSRCPAHMCADQITIRLLADDPIFGTLHRMSSVDLDCQLVLSLNVRLI